MGLVKYLSDSEISGECQLTNKNYCYEKVSIIIEQGNLEPCDVEQDFEREV
jgi:hypothetical protein